MECKIFARIDLDRGWNPTFTYIFFYKRTTHVSLKLEIPGMKEYLKIKPYFRSSVSSFTIRY